MSNRYAYHMYGGSWVVWDLQNDTIVAVRPDIESAQSATDRLNGIERKMAEDRDLADEKAQERRWRVE